MIIIHVSGTPGSGKTTLGKKFTAIRGVEVIDTDDVISEKELFVLRDTGSPEHLTFQQRWMELLTQNLKTVRDAAEKKGIKILIFVGILNQSSPESSPDKDPMKMPFKTVHKYFIDLPLPKLVRQFYLRYATELGDDEEWWTGVANQHYNIPGSVEYLQAQEKEKGWHVLQMYELASPSEIEKSIRLMIIEYANKV